MIHDRTLVADLAALTTMRDSFARDPAGKLFRYHDGVYVDGEFFLRQRVKHLLVAFQKAGKWTRKLADEVREFILLDAPEILTRPSPDILNLRNGLLDIWTKELHAHSPQLRSTIRIPVDFRPDQSCPRIDRFLQEVFPTSALELPWEILGDLITPDRSIQKAICLVGEGGNGKGVFSQLATRFVGEENVTHLSLQRLENDRFAVARLQGKLANICSDLPGERLTDSSIFKAITGCDRITGEVKYRNSFEFTPFVRLLFSANQLPSSRDASSAYFDRWVIVALENSFRNTEREIPRSVLDANLADPTELSGALNHALTALHRIRRRGKFSESQVSRGTVTAWRQSSDPCWLWLDSETVSAPSAILPQDRLYTAFAQACLVANRPLITRQMFGRRVKQWRPDIRECQRVVEGRRRWVYAGIQLRRLTSDGDGNSNHSIPTALCSGEILGGRSEESIGTIE